MTERVRRSMEREFDRFERRLPETLRRFVRFVRSPGARIVRWPLSLVLITGGFLGFLPVLGFWMVPLGLLLLAQDVPALRWPMRRLLAWINRRWSRLQSAAARRRASE